MKRMIIIVVSLLLIATGVGCVALSHYITPADVNKQAVEYVIEANVAELNEYGGWANLAKALKLQQDIDIAHEVNLFDIQHILAEENLVYSIHRDTVKVDATVGLRREGMLFGEKGLLSLGMTLAGFGTITGVLGLMRKRPKDWAPNEVEAALGEVKKEVTEKDKQVIEIVKGIQRFLDISDEPIAESLKTLLAMSQSTKTKETVATIKASI